MKPNEKCEVKANLEVKGKNYTGNKDMCVQDSCEYYLMYTRYIASSPY